MTCVMRVFGSAPDAQASIRACRLEPLPEMRTVRLYCRSAIAERDYGGDSLVTVLVYVMGCDVGRGNVSDFEIWAWGRAAPRGD